MQRSFQLWALSLALGVASGLATIILVLGFRSPIAENAVVAGVDPRDAVTLVVVAALVIGLLQIALAGLGYFFARKMRSGQNWARIVLAVLAACGALEIVVAVASHNHPAVTVLGVVHVLLMLAAAICAFQPSAAGWFRRRAEA